MSKRADNDATQRVDALEVGELEVSGSASGPFVGDVEMYTFCDVDYSLNGTSGHKIWVHAEKRGALVVVDFSLYRSGGIMMESDLPTPHVLATLPVGLRPSVSHTVDQLTRSLTASSRDTSWANNSYSTTGLRVNTSGELFLAGSGSLASGVQASIERVEARLSFFTTSSTTSYTADGIS